MKKRKSTTKRTARGTAAVRKKTTSRRVAGTRRSRALPRLKADLVLPSLRKHLLVDGFEIVLDLQKSKGSFIVDAKDGKLYLDFFTFVASSPIGLNHPKMKSKEFLDRLAYVAVNKPSLSDIYAAEQAEFLNTFSRVAIPRYLPHAFFIEGGALGVENAL